ncbi:outer membrane beta-barrel protein [Pseudoduganella sp. FT25W]|jgi:exopolysaccharide biosynthesis operon protein EpsL|uniref:Outer membrane beta-barrel protein n=1 Tax=Duganella alba TaxID=2666081 RepID=A0A6L5QNC7_9BURK|nr:XrtB/PEP-CTERM-associated polysaccharide biosynthesis outer membrane protein EpsL [Duganella alba]MRX11105.1 outer membrane beta-barrel protein [Duganella alba]MRX19234.1 outer membrane beta-barrel protein [Duganella alba]
MLNTTDKTPPPTRLSPLCRAVALALAAAAALPAQAQISDTIHPYILASINHDDNLLRQSADVGGEQGDTYKSTEVGLSLERPFGRQILTGRVSASKVAFDRFNQLDYTGKNAEATLEWHLGNHLQGHLGGTYAQTLAPFADFHSEERNLRVARREFVDGAWNFHPTWQVHGAWSRDKYTYELDSQKYNNRIEDAGEVGVDYIAGTSSRIGLVARKLKGTYTDRQGFASILLDNGYDQDELKANIYWYVSGSTQLQFLGGKVRRTHAVFTIRDEEGANGRAVLYWIPTGKIKTTTKVWREFAAVEGSLINSALNRGASVEASYQATAKISATALAKTEKRKFTALPGVLSEGGLDDSTRSLQAGVNYAIYPSILLALSASHDRRTGSRAAGTNSYKANGVSFNVTAQF